MKILYWTLARTDPNLIQDEEKADYQSDLSLIGLRQLFEENIIDYPQKKHLYTNYEGDSTKLWGKGFSNSKLLEDIKIDRDDLVNKKNNNYFSHIIYSVHHTIHHNPIILYNELQYNINNNIKSKIIIIDGNDLTSTYDLALQFTPYLFKREITNDRTDLIPISFAIPEEKILESIAEKKRYIAPILPADHHHKNRVTHIYNDEQSYYNQYAESYFGFSCKKGGFDGMRALEIFANGCINLYTDIENCPINTLHTFPKKMLSDIKKLPFLNLPAQTFTKDKIEIDRNYIDESKFDKQICNDLCQWSLDYAKKKLGTRTLGKYILDKIK